MSEWGDKYLPALIWSAIMVIATWATWLIITSPEQAQSTQTAETITQNDAIPPVVVDQPILEEISPDSGIRWTLYLDRIVRDEGAVTEMTKPRAVYRFKSGEVLEITGDFGSYDEAAHLLTLSENVKGKAKNANLSFSVDKLTWLSTESLLRAFGNVLVQREGVEFRGSELKLDLKQELASMEVTGGVEVVTAPEILEKLETGGI